MNPSDALSALILSPPSALTGLPGQVGEHGVHEILSGSVGVGRDARLVTTVGKLVLSRKIAEPAIRVAEMECEWKGRVIPDVDSDFTEQFQGRRLDDDVIADP